MIFDTKKVAVALIPQLRWHARTTYFPAAVLREIVFDNRNAPAALARMVPIWERLTPEAARTESVTLSRGRK